MIILKLPHFERFGPDEQKKTSLLFIIDGVLINAAVILTSGVFLSGYIVFLGGSDFLVGLLNNSLTWASIVALFSFLIYERLEHRKKFLLALLVISRLMVCSIIFLPPVFGKGPATLGALTLLVIVGNVLWGIYSIGYTVWMMSSFSGESRNEFVFQRMFYLRISFTLLTIIMGFVLDWSGKSYLGFAIVFLVSLMISAGDVTVLLRIKEPEHKKTSRAKINPVLFFEPLTRKKYRGFLLFIFFFYSSLTLSTSFTPLYLIRYMNFDYKFISAVNVIAYIFMIVCTKIWRRLEGKLGLMAAFKLTGLIAVVEMLIFGFLTADTYFLLYLAPVFSGIGNSGFNIFVFNYRYSLMPEDNKTVYEGWYGAVLGLSALIGPALGTVVMNRLPVLQNEVFQHSKFQLMYLISFVLATGVVLLVFKGKKRLTIPLNDNR